MPAGNNFQHSLYSRADPGARVTYGDLTVGASPDSAAWHDAMAGFGIQMDQAGVRAVIFLHGTYLNSDLFGIQRLDEVGGLKRGYSRGIAGLDALLSLMREGDNGVPVLKDGPRPPFPDDEGTKNLLDTHARDAANFPHAYVELFRKAVNRDLPRAIDCRRRLWSSEHHHLGRAHAAVQVLAELHALVREQRLTGSDRILVQAHGHAGLVMALVSNLLAPGPSGAREVFFQVLKDSAKQTNRTVERIQQVEAALTSDTPLNGVALDVVTFGTPIRYGWDPSGLGKLLHIVNHRPMRTDGKRWLAKMELPQITMEMPIAWGGDYVQQLAVAGSDAMPTTPEAKAANKALWELLEPYEGFERWLECTRKAIRCQNDGRCLLADYKDSTPTSSAKDHIYGHAAYTRMNAMLFNTRTITSTLYHPGSSV